MAKIYKVKKENYTVLSNTVIQDERLSWKARGIFAYLYAQHENWDFYESEVVKHSTDGRASMRAGLKELETYGYLKRTRKRDDRGQVGASDWLISDEPMYENQTQDKPKFDFPNYDNPTCDKPTLDNRTLTSTNKTNTNRTSTNNNNIQPKADSESDLKNQFAEIWAIYPKRPRGNKKTSFTKYKKALKDGAKHDDIKSGLNSYVRHLQAQGTDNKYIKNAETWFNQAGWEDEYSVAGGEEQERLKSAYGDWDF